MRRTSLRAATAALLIAAAFSKPALAAGPSQTRVGAAPAPFGVGTGVVIGFVDSGIDSSHPALAGTDSLGQSRLVAEANFVTTEPGNTGDDVFGHGSAVAAVALASDPTYGGMAPDARYVNARVLDIDNGASSFDWILNGAGFALAGGADVMNFSLTAGAQGSSGLSDASMMVDWITYAHRIPVVVAAGNGGRLPEPGNDPQPPSDAFNIFSAGASSAASNWSHVMDFSSFGPTQDQRSKPDITAPGHAIVTANDDWEMGAAFESWNGTSFSAPHVSGLLATQIGYGREHGLSVDPLVLKATMLNSAEKIAGRAYSPPTELDPWVPGPVTVLAGVPGVRRSLDTDSGAGQIDAAALYAQYTAGEQGPGIVGELGWDLHTVVGVSDVDYTLDTPLAAGMMLTATLTWYRHMEITDNGDGLLGAGDGFFSEEFLDNLDLALLRDGLPVFRSRSLVDNLEHLYFPIVDPGQYTIRVSRRSVDESGEDELYGLAWSVTAVPEPATWVLMAMAASLLFACRTWRRR